MAGPIPSSAGVRRRMQQQRRRDTPPEIARAGMAPGEGVGTREHGGSRRACRVRRRPATRDACAAGKLKEPLFACGETGCQQPTWQVAEHFFEGADLKGQLQAEQRREARRLLPSLDVTEGRLAHA